MSGLGFDIAWTGLANAVVGEPESPLTASPPRLYIAQPGVMSPLRGPEVITEGFSPLRPNAEVIRQQLDSDMHNCSPCPKPASPGRCTGSVPTPTNKGAPLAPLSLPSSLPLGGEAPSMDMMMAFSPQLPCGPAAAQTIPSGSPLMRPQQSAQQFGYAQQLQSALSSYQPPVALAAANAATLPHQLSAPGSPVSPVMPVAASWAPAGSPLLAPPSLW